MCVIEPFFPYSPVYNSNYDNNNQTLNQPNTKRMEVKYFKNIASYSSQRENTLAKLFWLPQNWLYHLSVNWVEYEYDDLIILLRVIRFVSFFLIFIWWIVLLARNFNININIMIVVFIWKWNIDKKYIVMNKWWPNIPWICVHCMGTSACLFIWVCNSFFHSNIFQRCTFCIFNE